MEKKQTKLPIEDLEKLGHLFKENNLEELIIETDEICIKFSKEKKSPLILTGIPHQIPVQPQPQISQPIQKSAPQPQPQTQTKAKSGSEFDDETKYHKVKSPINGTFYRSPSPGAAPFVKEGDHVNAGQTLCIVEAMKVMNEIKAPVSGKIVKILKNNAEIVKSEDILMIIEMV